MADSEPGKQFQNDESHGVYDPDSPKAVTKPNLQALEEGTGAAATTETGEKGLGDKLLSPDALGGAEKNLAGKAQAVAGAALGLGAGWKFTEAEGKTKVAEKIIGSGLDKRRKLLIGGGAGAAIAVLLVMSFAFVSSLVAKDIAETIAKYEQKVLVHTTEAGTRTMLNRIICRQTGGKLGKNCKDYGDEDDDNADAKKADDTSAESPTDPEPLTEEADTINLDSGQLAFDFGQDGIHITTGAGGEISGITNDEGEDASGDLGNAGSKAMTDIDNEGVISSFEPDMVGQAGATFAGITPEPGETDQSIRQELNEDEERGANGEDIAFAQGEEIQNEDNASDPNNPGAGTASTASSAEITEAQQPTGALEDGINTADQTFAEGGDAGSAVAAGANALRSDLELPEAAEAGEAISPTEVATVTCNVSEAITKAEKYHLPQLLTLIARKFPLIASLGGEQSSGVETSKEAEQVGELFNGNSAAPAGSEASKPATQAAAWHEDTGQPVDPVATLSDGKTPNPNFTPGIAATALPQKNVGSKIVDELNSVGGKSGVNFGCKVLTSPLGILVTIGSSIPDLIASIPTLGGSEIATIAANTAAIVTINNVILPNIVRYFSNLAVTGTDDAVQNVNNGDMSANLDFNNNAREMGGNPMTNSETTTITNTTNAELVADNNKQPWLYRTFALSDQFSLTTKLLDRVPILNMSSAASSMVNYFENIPRSLINNLSAIFTPKLFAASATSPAECATASNPDPTNLYCLTQYGFQDSEVDKDDPIQNEQYLHHNEVSVTACVAVVKIKGVPTCIDPITVTLSRIDMLGNPVNYNFTQANDPDSSDLLHCYVDSLADDGSNGLPDFANASSPDPICGTIGSFDYNDDPPSAQTVPGDNTIIGIYCSHLQTEASALGHPVIFPDCSTVQVPPQVTNHDDAYRFRQYLFDLHNMTDIYNLTTNQ